MKKFAKQLLRTLGYLAMIVLPVLLGWGVDDLRGFFRGPARAGYVVLGVLGALIVFIPRLNVQPFKKGTQVVGAGLFRAVYVSMIWTLVFVLLRMVQEERLLAEHFGSEFESYRRSTWRLLPYV
jgi:protein-S-isoprenylcysteine O-methyltransferase Ste14